VRPQRRIGHRVAIRLIRRRLGWTQPRLAKEIGCSQALVSLWERGERMPRRWLLAYSGLASRLNLRALAYVLAIA